MSADKPVHDYYEILQVHPRATQAVIKKAYRTLLLELGNHPDQGGSEANAALITEAYGVLSRADRRAAYDRQYFGQFHGTPYASAPDEREPHRAGPAASRVREEAPAASGLIVVCPRCSTKNRVRSQELLGVARCSRCGQPLSRLGGPLADLKEHLLALLAGLDRQLGRVAAAQRHRRASRLVTLGVPAALLAASLLGAGYAASDWMSGVGDPIATTDKLKKEGRFDEAARVLRRAADRDPDNPRWLERLGDIYVKQRNFEEAVAQYTRAIELSPQNAYLYTLRADTYIRLNNPLLAELSYKQALAIDPQYAPALVGLGTVNAKKQRFKEAASLFKAAMRQGPNADVLFNLGMVYEWDGRGDEAVTAFRQALMADPNHRSSMVSLASLLYEQGKYDLAAAQLVKASQLKHTDLDLHLRLAEIYEKTGHTDAAVREWKVCLEQGKDNPTATEKARRALTRLKPAVTG